MKEQDVCQVNCVHDEKVEQVSAELKEQNTFEAAKIFKALSDETRIKIAYSLYVGKELCVCDVAAVVNSSTATASHHLRLLKNLGLAKYRKEGKLVYYSLVDDHVKQLIHLAFEHQKELDMND
ncbi:MULTISPECIES: ArsR/SmtB family transcription factor [Mesobacillus]|uniref:ArsR/SmtB family transcription factor n=1 Tax=Mesobacillus TaxID=2675231 RepID=UPI0019E3D282|nr:MULTISPECIES: metalloregulator ArsR/SmtB family transcription factor [Mesobacillus]MCM3571774.1 metalloregulator ArsR/SmtB family transcription factor [Mesobacillus subterraneus]UYZ20672.1 metalloregulator ArsR/SmtB family transcription factor [Mesobacillus jeotgali]